MATKKQPVKEVRLGRIKAVIWKNSGSNGNGPLLNTTLSRLYKEPESDTWKESQSLGRDDLLLGGQGFGGATHAGLPPHQPAIATPGWPHRRHCWVFSSRPSNMPEYKL
jgi:hypothetical protein